MSTTLEQRIAAALCSDTTSDVVEALISEVETAAATADKATEQARERALDPTVIDAATRREAEDAAFTRDRLRAALPRLQQRLREVQAAEYAARWQLDFARVEGVRDELAREYAEFYPKFAAQFVDLLHRANEVDKEVSRVNGSALAGEHRRLAVVELAARNLGSFSTANPSIAKLVQLPDWEHSAKLAWPPPWSFDPAMIAPMVGGDPRLYTDRWWQVGEEQGNAMRERQEREAQEREAKALENYHGPRWWEAGRA